MSIKYKWGVREISPPQTYDWILKKHYAHRIPSISYAFCLYDENKVMQGICTFGVPASHSLCIGICGVEYQELVLELNRLCLSEGLPQNSASFLVGRSIKLLSFPKILVSYADKGMGHIGFFYQATNWVYTGETNERTDIATVGGKHSRHYDKKSDYNNRQLRTAKHRYIYFHRCPNIVKQSLRYSILPYPKGDSQRYNADYEPIRQGVLA
jgi:hypothetical protein